MLLILNSAVRVHIRHVQLRGAIYWFHLRVPKDLHGRFPTKLIRKSLETSDARVAARKAAAMAQSYEAQFKALRNDKALTPGETLRAAQALADEWGDLSTFVDHVVDPKWHRYLADQGYPDHVPEWLADTPEKEFLPAHEEAALRILQKGRVNAKRLSHAFDAYESTHEKAHDADFIAKVRRDWDGLMALVGDIAVEDLTREHGRNYIDTRLTSVKTTTVRRSLSHINAVLAVAWREWEIAKPNPFAVLKIRAEGHDAKEAVVPTTDAVKELITKFANDDSSTALLIRLQIGTGARIGELSGLAVADVLLDHETPHIAIKPQPWRSLKTEASVRDVPLLGVALTAATRVVALAKASAALFPEYAKKRGNDNASAAVNKRLAESGITSHSFRHWMKDALREVGCPEDIQKAIQGHSGKDIAANYGKGYSLKAKRRWLAEVAALIPDQ
ncbi:site-specific integrase [Ideonella sp.]|uniref:site-specific integrase n=1 Tax=Ideonella sp. TaxID=1929293 RepID=UPI002B47AB9E|nr:site-specific integrase [Ideonella sp.]HJV69498.1 site-specific integrase [Ideonella sp.]